MVYHYKCLDCNRRVSSEERVNLDPNESWCRSCKGEMQEIESDYEDEEDDSDTEFTCENCKKDIKKQQNHHSGNCDECGNDPICDNCLIMLESVSICKKCIDKNYPRKSRVEYVEKIIEKPIIKYVNDEGKEINQEPLNFLNKSKFD